MGVALISAGSAIIVGVLTLIGVLASNNAHDAVIDSKLEELTREVREHNDFAKKIPVIQNDIVTLYKKQDELKDEVKKLS